MGIVRIISVALSVFLIVSCGERQVKYPELEMTSDEIVQAFVEIYSIRAASSFNDESIRDSMEVIYRQQVETITGKSYEIFRSDFEKLKKMPDSLMMLESRALDTLRLIYENNYYKHKLKPEDLEIMVR